MEIRASGKLHCVVSPREVLNFRSKFSRTGNLTDHEFLAKLQDHIIRKFGIISSHLNVIRCIHRDDGAVVIVAGIGI